MDTTRTIPTPAAAAPRGSHDRAVWERTLLASELRRDLRLIGLILSHYADGSGRLPMDGPQRLETLRELELSGYIRRPNLHTWRNRGSARPIVLTLPAAASRPSPAPGGNG